MECLPASASCVLCSLADWTETTKYPITHVTGGGTNVTGFFDTLHEIANESVSGTDAEAHQVIDHALADLVVYGFDFPYIDSDYAKFQVRNYWNNVARGDKRYIVRALRRAARLSSSRGSVATL